MRDLKSLSKITLNILIRQIDEAVKSGLENSFKERLFKKLLNKNIALIFEKQGVTKVALVDKEGAEYVSVEAESCPVWGVWSMPTSDASYVCIEPWWGICDSEGYDGNLQDRPYTNSVEPGKIWQEGYKISVNV